MAFRYGRNYQTVHIYHEIQHIDIEPYKYTLKLQIYLSNRIHTILNYTCTSYRMHVHRTAYIYIEVTHLYSEQNTYTSKLHIYTSNQIHIHRNYTYINDTAQINRNAWTMTVPWKLVISPNPTHKNNKDGYCLFFNTV